MALEKNQLVLDRYQRLSDAFPAADFSADMTPLVQELQLYKTEEECQRLIEAGSTADLAFEIGFRHVRPGITEEEIVAEIEYELKKKGSKKCPSRRKYWQDQMRRVPTELQEKHLQGK